MGAYHYVWAQVVAAGLEEVGKAVGLASYKGAGQEHLLLLFFNACLSTDGLDPFLGVLCGVGLEVVVFGGRVEAEQVLACVFWVAQERDSCQLRQENLVPQLVFLVGFVDGQDIWAKNEKDGPPCLQKEVSLRALNKRRDVVSTLFPRTLVFCVRRWT